MCIDPDVLQDRIGLTVGQAIMVSTVIAAALNADESKDGQAADLSVHPYVIEHSAKYDHIFRPVDDETAFKLEKSRTANVRGTPPPLPATSCELRLLLMHCPHDVLDMLVVRICVVCRASI